jgi:ABC-type transport system involved in multi-copper enzyme maturation permease subunit
MTALTAPASPQQDPNLTPISWRRTVWVTWRQHRFALIGVAALLGALAAYLWINGLQLHHAYAAATACDPTTSVACPDLVRSFNGMNKILWYGYLLQALPALIGAFVGAPVLARELETGTFRYAWTQGFGRRRWTLAKLVLLAVIVVAATGAISVLFSWYYQPYFAAGNQALSLTEWSPFAGGLFDLRGIVFAAWTLAAFAIGGLAGALIRRVVPAIVATLVAYTGLAVATGTFVRQRYMTPMTTSALNVPSSAWITRQWWTTNGTFAFSGRPPIELLQKLCPASVVGPGKPAAGTLAQCLTRHAYTQWTSYQPASRFWPFQWIELGWLAALSVVLIAITVGMVRRAA